MDVKKEHSYIHLFHFLHWVGYARRTVLVLECRLIPPSPFPGNSPPFSAAAHICNHNKKYINNILSTLVLNSFVLLDIKLTP